MKEIKIGLHKIVGLTTHENDVILLHYKYQPLYKISHILDNLLGPVHYKNLLKFLGIKRIKVCTIEVI